jgi:hypothetical protein
MGSISANNGRHREFPIVHYPLFDMSNYGSRPSPFVLSSEGQDVQQKVWRETIALLKEEAPGLDSSAVSPNIA